MANSRLVKLLFTIAVMLTSKVHSVLLSISRDATAPSMRLWAKICMPKVMRQILSRRSLCNSDRMTRASIPDQGPLIPSDNPLRRMNNDKVNAGIRLIEEDNDFLLLWKTSNVAVDEGERLNRPASISVAEWVSNYLPADKTTVVYRHLLSSALSGVVMVAKSQSGRDFFSKSTALSSAELTYEAVVHDADLSTGKCTAAELSLSLSIDERLASITKNYLHSSIIASTADNNQKQLNFKVVKTLNSGSHGMLSLITITYTGSSVVESLTPALIMDILLSSGLTCVKENNRPYLSLTQISFKAEKQLYIKEKTPSKFLKLMRREEILFGRLSERNASLAPYGPDTSTHTLGGIDSNERNKKSRSISASDKCLGEKESVRALESVHFLGLDISVSDSALRPRNSSAVLVREAIAAIVRLREGESSESSEDVSNSNISSSSNSSNKKVRRILDLGCGSGALLLAVLEGLQTLTTPIQGLGVGIDMDLKALSTASINADRNGPFSCTWVAADFGLLHTSSVRAAVTNAVISCEGNGSDILSPVAETGTEAVQDDGLFDVIICNPPFLSSLAAAGRITREGDRVLVGGLTGMEPYKAICESVLKACNVAANDIQNESSDQMSSEPMIEVSNGSGRLQKRSLLMRAKSSQLAATTPDKSIPGVDRGQLLSTLPLLSKGGLLIFQVPGGERGWSDVSRVVQQVGGFTVAVVEDERGVKRCLALSRI